MIALLENFKIRLSRQLLKILFISAPESLSNQRYREMLEGLYQSIIDGKSSKVIVLQEDISGADFLNFLVAKQDFLFHGSNCTNIDILTPTIQENYRGNEINGVFASSDALWAMFFAIVNRECYRGSLRNGSFLLRNPDGKSERFYFFSINKEMEGKEAWKAGSVYILPRDSFKQTGTGSLRFDEWVSEVPVIPMGKIDISPVDFPLLEQVSTHDEQESIFLTWLMYKQRLKKKKSSQRIMK
jgi:hypothetical protein